MTQQSARRWKDGEFNRLKLNYEKYESPFPAGTPPDPLRKFNKDVIIRVPSIFLPGERKLRGIMIEYLKVLTELDEFDLEQLSLEERKRLWETPCPYASPPSPSPAVAPITQHP